MPRVSSSGARTSGPAPTSSSPPCASSHRRPAERERRPGAESAGRVQRLDDDESQPEPDQAGEVDRDRRGRRRARPSGSAGGPAPLPPGQACEQGDHAAHGRKRAAGWCGARAESRKSAADHHRRAPTQSDRRPGPRAGCRPVAVRCEVSCPRAVRGALARRGGAARGRRARAAGTVPEAPAGGRRRTPGGGRTEAAARRTGWPSGRRVLLRRLAVRLAGWP